PVADVHGALRCFFSSSFATAIGGRMTDCFCGHPRLLHDSWGCRSTNCGCRVSIIFLTLQLRVFPGESVSVPTDQDLIDESIRLISEEDKRQEAYIVAIRNRT